MTKKILTISFFLIAFFAAKQINASDLYISNPADVSVPVTETHSLPPYYRLARKLNQTFSPVYSEINGIAFNETVHLGKVWSWSICEMPATTSFPTSIGTMIDYACTGGIQVATGTMTTNFEKQSFPAYTVDFDAKYYLYAESNGNFLDSTVYVTEDNTYLGDFCFEDWLGVFTPGGYGYDLNFKLFTPNEEDPKIEITSPPLGFEGGLYKDFPDWIVKYTAVPENVIPDNNLCFYQITISYGTSSYIWIDDIYAQSEVEMKVRIPKDNSLNNGQYIVNVSMYDYCEATTTTLLGSNNYIMYIDNINGESAYEYEEDEVSVLSVSNVCDDVTPSSGSTLDDTRYAIECGARKILVWAFKPNESSIVNLMSSANRVKFKFPFSTFFDLTEAVEAGISSTTVSSNSTIKIPFINKSGDFVMTPVISSTTMSDSIGEENTLLVRKTITWIIWIMVSVVVFFLVLSI